MTAPFELAVSAETVFTDRPFVERVERIRDRGFAVELWGWQGLDIPALARSGARFSCMTGYAHGDLVDPDGAREVLRGAEQAIAVAAELGGVPRLVLHTGELADGLAVRPRWRADGGMWTTALRALDRLAALGERSGVVFCLENLNTRVDHPGVPLARAEDVLALVRAVGHPKVRMMLDLYHAQIGEGNLTELVVDAGDAIGEVQVADVPGRHEPGTGEIHYPRIARALVDMGWHGTVGLEAYPESDPDLALDRFRAAFAVDPA